MDYRDSTIKQLPRVTNTETSNTLFTIERLDTNDEELEENVPRMLLEDKGCSACSTDDGERAHHSNEYVVIGKSTYLRSDLETWLARDHSEGSAQAGENLTRTKTHATTLQGDIQDLTPDKTYANPLPLGLSSFGFSCMLLSMINAQVRGVTNNKIIIGAAFFYGGIIELIAGLFCFPMGDTFGMTVLGAYGGFWLSYGAILTDQFHIVSSYGDDRAMLKNALGLFLTCWAVFTTLCWLCTMKSTWGLFLCFTFLELTFILLACSEFQDSVPLAKSGGYFGILSALCAFYVLYSGVATPTNSYVPLRQYSMPAIRRPRGTPLEDA